MPHAVLVEWRGQDAAVLQAPQHRVGVLRAGERVGQVDAQRLDDRGAQQEVAQLGRLARQHLADQVVADRRVGAREVLDEVPWLRMVQQRGGGQPQGRRPALGASPEHREVLGGERHVERGEHRLGLVKREGEVGRADLGQAAVEAQAAEPDRRIRTGDDHERKRRRREPRQAFEVLVDRVDDLMEVVEHEDDGRAVPGERVDERRQHQVDPHRLARAHRERCDRVVARRPCQRLEDGAPEAPAVGVVGVQRQPGHRPRCSVCRDPRAQERALAGSGRGGHQRQRALDAGVEHLEQAGTDDRRLRPPGDGELRRQQGIGRIPPRHDPSIIPGRHAAVQFPDRLSHADYRSPCRLQMRSGRRREHESPVGGDPRRPPPAYRGRGERSDRTGAVVGGGGLPQSHSDHRRRAHARHAARPRQRAGVRRGMGRRPERGRSDRPARRQRGWGQRRRRARDLGRRGQARPRCPARPPGGPAVARASARGRRGRAAEMDAGDRHLHAGQGARDGSAALRGQPPRT